MTSMALMAAKLVIEVKVTFNTPSDTVVVKVLSPNVAQPTRAYVSLFVMTMTPSAATLKILAPLAQEAGFISANFKVTW